MNSVRLTTGIINRIVGGRPLNCIVGGRPYDRVTLQYNTLSWTIRLYHCPHKILVASDSGNNSCKRGCSTCRSRSRRMGSMSGSACWNSAMVSLPAVVTDSSLLRTVLALTRLTVSVVTSFSFSSTSSSVSVSGRLDSASALSLNESLQACLLANWFGQLLANLSPSQRL